MIDFATQKLADYIKQENIPINIISEQTNISQNVLCKSLDKLVRPLRGNEFLAICDFLNKNPNDFRIDILLQQTTGGELTG